MTEQNALQADDEPIEEIQAAETSDENTESAPVNNEDDTTNDNIEQEGGETEASEPPLTPGQQATFNKAMDKKTFKQRSAERERDSLRAELETVKSSLPQEQRPAIPPMPDQFANDFDEKTKTRDKAIADASAYDTRQETLATQKTEQTQRAVNERQQAATTAINTYTERATALGITPDELAKSGDAVAAYGINDAVVLHILGDEKGPALTKYLAENPIAMDKLNGLTPMQAAVHIENVVKPAALKMKKTTNAPPPSTNLEGGGSPPSDRGPKGATFE